MYLYAEIELLSSRTVGLTSRIPDSPKIGRQGGKTPLNATSPKIGGQGGEAQADATFPKD